MANINILTGSADGATLTAAFHYSTPTGNNAVGVPWSTALVNSGMGGASVMTTGAGAGQISSTDLTALQAGTLREIVQTFQILGLAGMTALQKQTALNNIYNAAVTADQAKLSTVLNFFGYTQ